MKFSQPNRRSLEGLKAVFEQSWKEEKGEHASEPWKGSAEVGEGNDVEQQ